MEDKKDICRLAEEFEECQKILLALGDENRQHLILEMMQMLWISLSKCSSMQKISWNSCRIGAVKNLKTGGK